ncbi:MAG: hypothetical protein ABJL57_18465 [Hyphomonas sp.]|uniref:hypothetical protein n=1 Tax=Alphaproteobacteria TaxID=28211 RepID=UPI0032658488
MANKIRTKDIVWTDYKLTLSQLRQAAKDADRVGKCGKSIVLYALAGETNEDGEPVFRNPNLRGNTHFLAALPKTPIAVTGESSAFYDRVKYFCTAEMFITPPKADIVG